MNNKGWNIIIQKSCKLDTDFQRLITFQRDIEGWIDGELDTVGKVETFKADSVKIEGNLYMRENGFWWTFGGILEIIRQYRKIV
jgi:hypothetical protein